MGYPTSLDEMDEEKLRAEIDRRGRLRRDGKCDYCERPPTAPTCKFEDRHTGQHVTTPFQTHNETRAWAKVEEVGRELTTLRKRMTFADLRTANMLRLPEFKNNLGKPAHSEPDGSDWTLLEWAGAMCGEAGEASNVAKKFRRGDYCVNNVTEVEELADEIADNIIYADILAAQADIDLGEAVRRKWNKTSAKIGYEGRV